jgi:hypothetical protein
LPVREVSEAAPLLTLLRRIRRRLRWWMALEGAVAGAAVGGIALAVTVIAMHIAGAMAGLIFPAVTVAVLVVGGALARGTRRISLASCARFADAALDGQDRVLSAYCLREEATPLARALVIDAAARARTLTPGGAVAPRRPGGLPALAVGAIALAAAAIAPVRSRAARAVVAPSPASGVPLGASALDVERDEARRAAAAATALGDERLAKLAVDLDGTLRRLAAGKMSDGDAMEKLAALQRRAAEAAADAGRDAKALEAAQKALEAEKATRGAGEALATEGSDAGGRARAAMGAAAAENPTETARALSAAAQAVANAVGTADRPGEGDGQRRLARDGDNKNGDAASDKGAPGERRLERLQRNLGNTAAACRDGDPTCRSQAEKRGEDLSQLMGRGASAEALRRLERALRQMHERIGRGETRGGDQSAMRGFDRAARGDNGQSGEGEGKRQGQGQGQGQGREQKGDGVGMGERAGPGAGDSHAEDGRGSGSDGKGKGGDGKGKGADGKGKATDGKGAGERQASGSGQGEGDGDGDGAAAIAEAAALAEQESSEGGVSTTPGGGAGTEAGGRPLGRRGDMQTRGHETEARVANGAGPNRAEVIGGAADRGFAQRDYARVFSDYQAAVEDALAATAVPEGRRYVVRRYFDLIRPRSGKGHK